MISGNGLVQPFLANDETALFRMELKRVIRKLSFSIAMHTLGLEAPSEITQQDLNIVIRAANNRQGPF